MVPIISVDSKGRITDIKDNPCTIKTPVYTAERPIILTDYNNRFGLETRFDRYDSFKVISGCRFSNNKLYLSTRGIEVDKHGLIDRMSIGSDITIDLSSLAGISISSETYQLYIHDHYYTPSTFVAGSQLYSSYSKRDKGFSWYGQQNGTWIAIGNAWLVDRVEWTETSGNGSHSSTTSHSSAVYAQRFRRLSI